MRNILKHMIFKSVKIWLLVGLVMILIQIMLGGITRLTGSGLSITKWDIVTGILFPISEESWNYHFELYKKTPQYSKINTGMSLDDFKFIFFWEYLHRLWARFMGLVFVLPLIYFLFKNRIDKYLGLKLSIIFILALFVASLGWIMVASGFVNRPWVSAYKLSFHLIAATILLGYLLWTYLNYSYIKVVKNKINLFYLAFSCFVFIQLFFGGVMSGMKAGLVAPTWPSINSFWVPMEVKAIFTYDKEMIINYDESSSLPIVVQFIHRSCAYIIFGFVIYLNFFYNKNRNYFRANLGFLGLVLVQIILGVMTLINCIGEIPLFYGVMHQMFGILLFCYSLLILYFSKNRWLV
ncbi:MAG: COX15/CtaA family protein [Saprospiraceae bacterium]|nr:COX15/CtaA family protein [Candidatus Defluviibacterium haderslevense]